MKSFFGSKTTLFLGVLLLAPLPGVTDSIQAYAIENPAEKLSSPQQEILAEKIGRQLRCPVCQNANIEESNAPLAKTLRTAIRQQVATGKKEEDILQWMQTRYGDFIFLAPPFSRYSFLLWLTPFLTLFIGIFIFLRRQKKTHIGHTKIMMMLGFLLLLSCVGTGFYYGAGRHFSLNSGTLLLLFPLPVLALALYAFLGNPSCPSGIKSLRPELPDPIKNSFEKLYQEADHLHDSALKSEKFRFLAEIEWRTHERQAAIKSWKKSLESQFSPEASMELAEAETEMAGYVTQEAQKYYEKALEKQPRAAKGQNENPLWTAIANKRLMQAEAERKKENNEKLLLSDTVKK